MRDYGRRLVIDTDFDRTLAEAAIALEREGLTVITRFDVKDHLQRLLHHDCRRYVLLQVASPDLMLRALQADVESGPFLPATVAVYELADGESAVEAVEPFAPMITDRAWRRACPALAAIADRESEQIARALSRVAALERAPQPAPL